MRKEQLELPTSTNSSKEYWGDAEKDFPYSELARLESLSTKATSAGLKYDAGKPSLELIDTEAEIELAKVLDFGARKYNAHNWRNGIQWSRTIGAALRHLRAFNAGEDKDPETGLSHVAHAMCNCMFLLYFETHHKELDDRFKEPLLDRQSAESQQDHEAGTALTESQLRNL
jgi:hypothetical protein